MVVNISNVLQDVRSLFPNVVHAEGIEACGEVLNTIVVLEPPTENIIKSITLILAKNNFLLQ